MKYDLNNKTNRFAQRTLAAFSETLFTLLMKKPFEEITVNELCEISNYPRATFYNYFEDIYDLLNYCWLCLSKEINLEDYVEMKPEERLYEIFSRIYDFMDSNFKDLESVLKYNQLEGKLIGSFQKYLREQIRTIMKNCSCNKKYPVPFEMVVDHYSNTLQLVIEWSFFKKERYFKEKAQKCIVYLLKCIEEA